MSIAVRKRLEEWQQALLDLSNRNRLLNYRPSTTKPTGIELVEPAAEKIFQILSEGGSLEIIGTAPKEPSEDSTDGSSPPLAAGLVRSELSPERLGRVALRLAARARSSEQEQGINMLFAVFGILKWHEHTGERAWRFAPLILLPIRLAEHARHDTYVVKGTGDDPEFNQTLVERLRQDFGLTLDPAIKEMDNLSHVLDAVRTAVAAREGWEVRSEVHLSTFQFHKLRMFMDLAEHADIAQDHPIVQALATDTATIAGLPDGVPTEEELDRRVPAASSHAILDADAK